MGNHRGEFRSCPIFFDEPSLTKQSFTEQCDINRILARFIKNGEFDHVSRSKPVYGDFSTVGDYKTALDRINAVEANFEALPAIVRKRFDNDPASLLEFIEDPANFDEAVSLGLCMPKEKPAVSTLTDGTAKQESPTKEA